MTSNKKIKLIAHRGLSGYSPENSMAAFNLVDESKYFGIEADIHSTKDNQLVVFHDYTLTRMTGNSGFIKDYTYNELSQMKLTSGNYIEKYNNERIPLFIEYLNVCINKDLNAIIEIKEVNEYSNIDQLLHILKKNNYLNKSKIISFNLDYLIYIRNKDNNLSIQYLVETITKEKIDKCKKYNFDISAYYKNLNETIIEVCNKEKIKMNVWTIDDEKLFDYFKQFNIDFITTNKL